MVTPDLPEEILIEIFSRLPTKPIGKFRSLSKTWRNLLSTPQFIKSHLAQKTHQEENLILISRSLSIHSITTLKDDDAVSRKLKLPGIWSKFGGSCDGLVLLVNKDYEKLLLNPITLEHVKIPNSPLALKRSEGFTTHGFGYDTLSDDYKVVTLSYYVRDNEYDPGCVHTHVDVYSVKRSVWKRVEVSPYDHTVVALFSGAFVNRAIHWAATRRESDNLAVIAAFDLVNEVFSEIPGPSGVYLGDILFNNLVVLGGCLCLVDACARGQTDVWIMKEYGVAESWTKFSICAAYRLDNLKFLWFVGDEDFVLVTDKGTLVAYNRKEGTSRYLVVDGVRREYVDGGTFVESLVSPALWGHQGEQASD